MLPAVLFALVGAVAGSAVPPARGLDSGARATPARLVAAVRGIRLLDTVSWPASAQETRNSRGDSSQPIAPVNTAITARPARISSVAATPRVIRASRFIEMPPVRGPRPRVVGRRASVALSSRRDEQRREMAERSPERGDWQESYDLQLDPAQEPLTLLVRGAALPGAARLIVFDDISEVVSAQRAEAWSEVARRLAHEIKNPLTPIQLSAERLQHKLEARLEGADRNMLVRSVHTIVDQVQAMKQLVNEFRDYARLPTVKLQPVDLNALVADVLHLYGNEADAGTLVADCTPGLPLIQGDPTLLRQVVHNLVQNALDAVAERPAELAAHAPAQVCVRTSLKRDEQGQPQAVRLTVVDNGPGFADKLLKRAFEPYVTTKAKGTGLGLAVVKKIADEHGAVIRLRNREDARADDSQGPSRKVAGAQVSLSFSRLTPVAPAASHTPSARSRRALSRARALEVQAVEMQ